MRMGKTQKRMRNERWMIEKKYCLTWMEGGNRGHRIELKEGRVNTYKTKDGNFLFGTRERANEGMIFLTLSYRF